MREHARHHRRRQVVHLGLAPGRRLLLARHQEHEGHGAGQADDARQDEGHLPAEALGDVDRDAGGDGDAHVAGKPVHADGEAGVLGLLHQHGDADRMVDRGEGAHQRQRRADLPLVAAERDHQATTAPMPAKKITIMIQRPQWSPSRPLTIEPGAEHEQRAVVEGRELGPFDAPDAGDDAPAVGEHHEDPVVHGVADIEQDRGRAGVAHRRSNNWTVDLNMRLCLSCARLPINVASQPEIHQSLRTISASRGPSRPCPRSFRPGVRDRAAQP